MPEYGSKHLLSNDEHFQKALIGAAKGDVDYMIGLVDWYARHGDMQAAKKWSDEVAKHQKENKK